LKPSVDPDIRTTHLSWMCLQPFVGSTLSCFLSVA